MFLVLLALVRANPAVALFAAVAVETEDLEVIGEAVPNEPGVDRGSSDPPPVRGSVVLDVVDAEEHGLILAAASTATPVTTHHPVA
jgi:hypothetical protein